MNELQIGVLTNLELVIVTQTLLFRTSAYFLRNSVVELPSRDCTQVRHRCTAPFVVCLLPRLVCMGLDHRFRSSARIHFQHALLYVLDGLPSPSIALQNMWCQGHHSMDIKFQDKIACSSRLAYARIRARVYAYAKTLHVFGLLKNGLTRIRARIRVYAPRTRTRVYARPRVYAQVEF